MNLFLSLRSVRIETWDRSGSRTSNRNCVFRWELLVTRQLVRYCSSNTVSNRHEGRVSWASVSQFRWLAKLAWTRIFGLVFILPYAVCLPLEKQTEKNTKNYVDALHSTRRWIENMRHHWCPTTFILKSAGIFTTPIPFKDGSNSASIRRGSSVNAKQRMISRRIAVLSGTISRHVSEDLESSMLTGLASRFQWMHFRKVG